MSGKLSGNAADTTVYENLHHLPRTGWLDAGTGMVVAIFGAIIACVGIVAVFDGYTVPPQEPGK